MPGEQLLETQASGGSIMFWGTFTLASVGLVILIECTITCVEYVKIIADHLHPITLDVFPDDDGTLQQDVSTK